MNLLQNIWNLLCTIWNLLCGVKEASQRQVSNFLKVELCLILVGLGGLIAGFVLKNPIAIAATGVLCSLAFLVLWKSTDIFISLVDAAGKKLPLAGEPIEAGAKELRKLVGPILTTSLAFSFVAALILLRGPGAISFGTICAILTSCLFVVIFTYYIESTRKWSGWVMAGILGYFWVGYFAFPVQVQSTTDYLAKRSTNLSMQLSQKGQGYDLAVLPAGTPTFKKDMAGNIAPAMTITQETKAKIIGRVEDPDSKEGLYEAILPDSNGLYIGGVKVLVPVVLAKAVKSVTTEKADTNNKIVFEREYTGQGWGENDWVPTAMFGKDIKIGYQMVVTSDKNFQVWNTDRWYDYPGIHQNINYTGTKGPLGVKAAPGQKFKVTILKS